MECFPSNEIQGPVKGSDDLDVFRGMLEPPPGIYLEPPKEKEGDGER